MDGHPHATRHTASTRITGHRGARELWPENSLLGFANVTDLAVDAIEFDVHLTDSGELLVLHDPWLERTTDGSGPVRALTPADRCEVRLTGTVETIPTLAEVLDALSGSLADLHVELKNDENGRPYPGLAERVLAEIDRRGLRGRCHLASFDVTVLQACRRLAPDVARLVSVDQEWSQRHGGMVRFLETVEGLVDIVAVSHRMLAGQWELITARMPTERLCVWTVNDSAGMRRWMDLGIGHLTTDRPDLALRVRGVGR